ncbi:MAG: exodeoxyribonuclease V subunit alpha [Thermodesulfobacteria bacterium]|nr:exodeoxyribonuclease V subunit alpha [Thermodesulfobacteriota bacterium]
MIAIPRYTDEMLEMAEASMGHLLEAASLEGFSRAPAEIARFASRMEAICCGMPQEGEHEEKSQALMLAAFLCALALEGGDSCIELNGKGIEKVLPAEEDSLEALRLAFPNLFGSLNIEAERDEGCHRLADILLSALNACSICSQQGDDKPFVLDGIRMYMHRYWSYEQKLSLFLKRLSSSQPAFFQGPSKEDAVCYGLQMADTIFGHSQSDEPDWQKSAAVMGLFRSLLVVTGGPGTGKTWTVTALMAVLQAAALKMGNPLRIALCAPTGKAAARLNESVAKALSSMNIPEDLKNHIPSEASTIHRLLGAGVMPGRFRYHASCRLPFDVLVVDEASMVDLPLMVHLTEAMDEGSSLVLIGDMDQLPSVDAGRVLADICSGLDVVSASSSYCTAAELISSQGEASCRKIMEVMEYGPEDIGQKLRGCLVRLTKTHRFEGEGGISKLASAINNGDLRTVWQILEDDGYDDARFVDASCISIEDLVRQEASGFLEDLYRQATVTEALFHLDDFKILCGTKRGAAGVENLNRIMNVLAVEKSSQSWTGFFKGMPVAVNRNDYYADLYNGDTGICWPDHRGRMMVWFQERDGDGPRSFSPGRLPHIDTAWALTIHRSQGSEFSKVLVTLPPASSPLSGRELLYTAVTRAKKQVILFGNKQDLDSCITNKKPRLSGLGRLLWG